MGKMGRVKARAAAPVPQTRDDVVDAIAAIGRHQRARARIEADMADEIAAVKQRYEALAEPEGCAIRTLSAGVQAWCEAHRAELTDGGKVKTARLASGEVRWRMTPPSVAVKGVDAVLQLLRERGLLRFIREKLEVNKEAILAEPEAVRGIAGIRVTQEEEFVIAPFDVALGEVA
jgi:phage host-nuclease inhibitor protein Gam